MTVEPGVGVAPGIFQALLYAAQVTGVFTAIGGGVAWLCVRRDKRRDDRRKATETDEAEELGERRFLDERARTEIARLEQEREAARAECRASNEAREALLRELWEMSVNCVEAVHEAARCQQLVISLHERPVPAGTPPPAFPVLPDPRRRPKPT